MASVAHELTIDCHPDEVYRVSQDYAVRRAWDPFPDRIELLDGATAVGRGVRARVFARNGLRMEVEFVQVAPPTTAAIRMTRGPVVLAAFAGSWIFRPAPGGRTHARFVYSIRCRRWALPPIADALAAWYFRRVVRQRLQGLKHYCEFALRTAD